ncbi:MAG: 2Fe-2S iron-sulfur cluster binding domain-containing protein [Chitinophagaceae bacterium]|nr:MAG: 2Fe-2S iron-sulfur cluster binding domain-containing protein [Chitinophagaceae bacterium]
MAYTVTINYKSAGIEQQMIQRGQPGQTLLELCLDNQIDLHFNCGGVCSCSTCHILINTGENYLEEKSKREMDFIKRARNAKPNSRLACQCLLLNDEGEIEMTIPEQIELT